MKKRQKIEIISEDRSWFFEKKSKTDKPLARHGKQKIEKAKMSKIRTKQGKLQLIPQQHQVLREML